MKTTANKQIDKNMSVDGFKIKVRMLTKTGDDDLKKITKDIIHFAEQTGKEMRTPVGVYLEAGAQLIAVGALPEDVVTYLQVAIDITVGAKREKQDFREVIDVFSRIIARGKITTVEIGVLEKQLPAFKALANAYKVEPKEIIKLMQQGKLLSKEALPKLIEAINNGTIGKAGITPPFKGLAKKMRAKK